MKTPLRYYGGKQQLVPWLSQFIPPHKIYVEPFAGGLSLFFGRPKSKNIASVINDTNSMIYNLWKQLRENPNDLYRVLNGTLYSREDICRAPAGALQISIYEGKLKVSKLEQARATFFIINSSFGAKADGGFVATNKKYPAYSFSRQVSSLMRCQEVLKKSVIENLDALKVILKYDSPESFFYLDPPYPEAHQGHYSGYTMEDFNRLCSVLKAIDGKFMLSCYLKDEMEIDAKWKVFKKTMACKAERGEKKTNRTETILMNY